VSRRAAGFVLGLAAALLVGGVGWWWLSNHPFSLPGSRTGTAGVEDRPVVRLEFDLFFPTDGGLIKAERRKLEVTDDPRDRIRKLVAALLEGPKAGGRYPLFPEGVKLDSVLLAPNGTAYIDLSWPGHTDPPPSGSQEEGQRVWSLVNTVTYNVEQAQRVVLLWGGGQRETFAGHLDTSGPLANNPDAVAR
jgi:hypothetical protein